MPPELPQPGDQIGIHPGLDVERSFRVKEPFEALGNHLWFGQGYAVTGYNQAGIAVGTAGTNFTLFDQGDTASPFGEIISGADPDRPVCQTVPTPK